MDLSILLKKLFSATDAERHRVLRGGVLAFKAPLLFRAPRIQQLIFPSSLVSHYPTNQFPISSSGAVAADAASFFRHLSRRKRVRPLIRPRLPSPTIHQGATNRPLSLSPLSLFVSLPCSEDRDRPNSGRRSLISLHLNAQIARPSPCITIHLAC